MSKVYKTLKKKYVFLKEGDRNPRTKLVPDEESKMRENEDLLNREGLWMGTLDVKPPADESHPARFSFKIPRKNTRPKFHVAAKNAPIPEPPPTRFSFDPIPHEIAHAHLILPPPVKSVTKQELARDLAEADRNKAVRTLNDYRKHTRIMYEEVKNLIKELDALKREDQYDHDLLERYKRNYVRMRRKRHELKDDKAIVQRRAEETVRLPTQLRESNRILRQQLVTLEADLVDRKEEWRFLRYYNKDGDGFAVHEMRRLNSLRRKLDQEILDLATKRRETHITFPTISVGLAKQIGGLIQTNEQLFSTATPVFDEEASGQQVYDNNGNQILPVPPRGETHGQNHQTNYGRDYNGNRLITWTSGQTPKSRQTLFGTGVEDQSNVHTALTNFSIEKAKIRRMQIEEKMKTLAPSAALRKLLELPVSTSTPKKSAKSSSSRDKEDSDSVIGIIPENEDENDDNEAEAEEVEADGDENENLNTGPHEFFLPPKSFYSRSGSQT